ncbi:MAG: helix-turn-helix transcriptional regulator [Petrimonas sp.]|jgi:transcriptional regulator with XRE-family HTH domain|nr:helix-turn-helix transcriptional regulator [Petrimonas sp.]
MKNEKIAFAERFKELREENKWKKIEVAKLLNCSKSLITEYEQGKKLPRFEMLVKMRKIFRKPVEYITI